MKIEYSASILKSLYNSLEKQMENTQSNWDDQVQRRFYSDYIDQYKKLVPTFIKSLEQLDIEMKIAFEKIKELEYNDSIY